MQEADRLIRTKLHLPFTRSGLVPRPGLQARIAEGLCGPLTLITAPAGFGKTTLVVSCIAGCGKPAAWLSLDKDDNRAGRFLSYLVAALQEADPAIGNEAAQLLAAAQQALPEQVLTGLINDLDAADGEIVLVLDDYQFISNQEVHGLVASLLEHCPKTFHLVIATRSDPPLPLARLRARGQIVELRAADLRFSELEAAQFLNEVMGLCLDSGSVAALAERTEGWVAGLQMAALSMRDREDVLGFIEGFSGTNRYILDYLLEEVLAGQPAEVQHFLLYTSILDRLTASLCDAVLADEEGVEMQGRERLSQGMLDRQGLLDHEVLPDRSESLFVSRSAAILEYLERANLFLVPLDDERFWYRYHHLFADLLRTQLHKSLGGQGVARLHLRASEWYEQYGSTLEAIHHASLASDFERIERLIEQNYMDMMNHGEMSWVRLWMGKLSKELVYRRPWLCLYEALSRSWFGQLEEANLLLNEAEKRIRSEISAPDIQSMLGYHAYVLSRVTAMQGDTRRAIELCRAARENIPDSNLGLQIDVSITLGYEYFLYGDFVKANQTLHEMIQSGYHARAINNPVAGYAVLARLHAYQGQLYEAYDLLQKAAQLIQKTGGQHLGVGGLVEVGVAALLYEWGDLKAALERVKHGLGLLPLWGKADDVCLANITLSRIQLALGNLAEAEVALEKAAQLIQTRGVFSEARSAVETSQVKMWLARGDRPPVDRWAAALDRRLGSHKPFQFEDELARITRARIFLARENPEAAIRLLSCLEACARSGGRQGRLIEIMLLKAIALQEAGDSAQAEDGLTKSLALAEPQRYLRTFLDEGRPMQLLLSRWLVHAGSGPLRDYAVRLLSEFDAEPRAVAAAQVRTPGGDLVEPLSRREMEVLRLIALGRTNREIAQQLIVSPGTVKAHTSAIYRKLDVANRTEAVARARQLDILH